MSCSLFADYKGLNRAVWEQGQEKTCVPAQSVWHKYLVRTYSCNITQQSCIQQLDRYQLVLLRYLEERKYHTAKSQLLPMVVYTKRSAVLEQ